MATDPVSVVWTLPPTEEPAVKVTLAELVACTLPCTEAPASVRLDDLPSVTLPE